MALANLMKKGFLTLATATPTTPATNEKNEIQTAANVALEIESKTELLRLCVAPVADVAVAKPVSIENQLTQTKIDELRDLLYQSKLSVMDVLELFHIEVVQKEVMDGYSANQLRRVNNMALEFMAHDKMPFSEAITAAGEIVFNLKTASCETAYVDVLKSNQGLKNEKNY